MNALHKQDAYLVFSATSAEKSQKLLRTLSNRDRKRKDSQNEKKWRHERTKTQWKPLSSLSFRCAHPLPPVIALLYLGAKASRGYTGHKAGFHPITSGYMTQTLNLWENQSETSRDRCMKMAPVTSTRLTVSFQRLIGYDVTWTWPQEFDWRIRRNLAIKRCFKTLWTVEHDAFIKIGMKKLFSLRNCQ